MAMFLGRKRFKMALAGFIFSFLGKGFQATAKHDKQIQSEMSCWPEGFTITMKIAPKGPGMTVRKLNNMLHYLGGMDIESPDITIWFKNIEAALPVLLGQKGIAQAFAEHRFTLKGDIAMGMGVVRCMYIVKAYLFPKFIAKHLMDRVPKKEVSSIRIYTSTIFGRAKGGNGHVA